jgi:cytochrome c oxidase subunit 2
MKTLLKVLAIAAALGMAPAAANAQAAAPTQPAEATQPSAPPADPAQPGALSSPALENAPAEEPSDAAVAETAQFRSTATVRPSVGQPDGRMMLQDQYTPIGEEAAWFHNWILMPAITVISLFVLLLLGIVIVRYRRGANPVPSRTTHNTVLEVLWTLVPVLILVIIAVPSFRLLSHQYSPPEADITIKAVGNQWFWTYEYPDHGIELVSQILSDQDASARGEPRQLAVDQRLVVPAGATVKMIVTSNDVIHAWAVPSFWVNIDAVPGRLNETWFRVEEPGIYYGVCRELCGARHGYMPIAVEVVPREQFAGWVASQGGTMPGAPAAPAPAAAPAVTAASPTEATPAPTEVIQANTTAPALPRESTQTD